jgi:hypothetical protein
LKPPFHHLFFDISALGIADLPSEAPVSALSNCARPDIVHQNEGIIETNNKVRKVQQILERAQGSPRRLQQNSAIWLPPPLCKPVISWPPLLQPSHSGHPE